MITQNQYHCFIAGLPDISFDDHKEWVDMPSFKKILKENLHPDDYRQVEMVFLEEDNRTLTQFLAGEREQSGDTPSAAGKQSGSEKQSDDDTQYSNKQQPTDAGNFSYEDYNEQLEIFSAILPPDDILPPYMVEVMKEIHEKEDEEKTDMLQIGHRLAEGYYSYIMANGSPFLKAFTEFNYNLKNLVAFTKGGDHGMEQEKFITGASEHAAHLRNYTGKSLAKDPEFEFFEEILSYSNNTSFAEEERKYDRLRWQRAEEMTFFEYFTIDSILGYLQQMKIIARWAPLDKASGEEKLRDIVNNAWQEPAVDEEYAN